MLRHRVATAAASVGLCFLSGCFGIGQGQLLSRFCCRDRVQPSTCCDVGAPGCDGTMMGAPMGPMMGPLPTGPVVTPQQTLPPLAPTPRLVPTPAPGAPAGPSQGL